MGVNLRHGVLGMCSIVFTVAAINSNQSIHPVTRDQWRSCVVITRYIYVTPPPPGVRWSPDWVLIARSSHTRHLCLTVTRSCHNNQMVRNAEAWSLEMLDITQHCLKFCKMRPVWYQSPFITIWRGIFAASEGSCVLSGSYQMSFRLLRNRNPQSSEPKSPEEVRDQVPSHFW